MDEDEWEALALGFRIHALVAAHASITQRWGLVLTGSFGVYAFAAASLAGRLVDVQAVLAACALATVMAAVSVTMVISADETLASAVDDLCHRIERKKAGGR